MPWSDDWDGELYAEGYQTGQNWARRNASCGELRRLQRFYDVLQPLDWDTWWVSAAGQISEVLAVMSIIDPHSEEDPQAAREYWEQIVGRNDSDAWETEFVLGFTEGAIEVEPSTQLDDMDNIQADARVVDHTPTDSEPSLEETDPPGSEEYGKAFRGMTL